MDLGTRHSTSCELLIAHWRRLAIIHSAGTHILLTIIELALLTCSLLVLSDGIALGAVLTTSRPRPNTVHWHLGRCGCRCRHCWCGRHCGRWWHCRWRCRCRCGHRSRRCCALALPNSTLDRHSTSMRASSSIQILVHLGTRCVTLRELLLAWRHT